MHNFIRDHNAMLVQVECGPALMRKDKRKMRNKK
jgi:hypothetical protein